MQPNLACLHKLYPEVYLTNSCVKCGSLATTCSGSTRHCYSIVQRFGICSVESGHLITTLCCPENLGCGGRSWPYCPVVGVTRRVLRPLPWTPKPSQTKPPKKFKNSDPFTLNNLRAHENAHVICKTGIINIHALLNPVRTLHNELDCTN